MSSPSGVKTFIFSYRLRTEMLDSAQNRGDKQAAELARLQAENLRLRAERDERRPPTEEDKTWRSLYLDATETVTSLQASLAAAKGSDIFLLQLALQNADACILDAQCVDRRACKHAEESGRTRMCGCKDAAAGRSVRSCLRGHVPSKELYANQVYDPNRTMPKYYHFQHPNE